MLRQFPSIVRRILLAIFLVGLIGSAPVLDRLLDPVNVVFFEPEAESLESEVESDLDPLEIACLTGELTFSPERVVLERLSTGTLSATDSSACVVRLRGPPAV
jgi:hypothetical protein